MAGLADMLVGSALQNSSKLGEGAADLYHKGAELAIKVEQNAQQKQQIAQEQQKMQLAKWDKVGGWFDTLAKMPEGKAKNAFAKNFIPKGLSAMGMQDQIDPTVLEMMQNDSKLATYLRSEITAGRMDVKALMDPDTIAKSYPDALRYGDASAIAKTVEDNPEAMVKATEEAQKNSATAAAARAAAAKDFNDRKQHLDEQIDKRGLVGSKINLKNLDALIPGGIDGYAGGNIPGVTGLDAKKPTNALKGEAKQIRQASLGLVNSYLKQQSGTAVNDSELQRQLAALGMQMSPIEGGGWVAALTPGNTPDAKGFITGMQFFKNKLREDENQLKRTYGSDVYSGVTGQSAQTEQGPPAKPGKPAQGAPPPGAPPPGKRDPAELQTPELMKKIADFVGTDAGRLNAMAVKYGMTPAQFQKFIGGQ